MEDRFTHDERLSHASTIPSYWYTSERIYARELTHVFGKTWQLAGHSADVPAVGDYFTTQVGDEPVIVVRGHKGVCALSNVCRHRAGPVAEGKGRRVSFRCGYHGWTYGLDGRLIVCPEFEGVESFEKELNRLPEFQVRMRDGFMFVNLDATATELSTVFEGIESLPQYQHTVYKDWFIDCNWKVYVDNYLEGYHIPIVHPELNRELDYTNYRTELFPFGSLQRAPIGGKDQSGEARYYWIFPNLMVNVYPDNFSTNLIIPLGPNRTRTVFEWYFPTGEDSTSATNVGRVVDASDRIQREDIAICESVQRGLRSSTYTRGRYSVKRESGVHHFHGLLSRFLKD